jgi:hypothetical protein
VKTISGPARGLSCFSARLQLLCLCLIGTLSACFFDASKLRPPPPDGAGGSPDLPDAVLGGSGGTAGEVGGGGSTGADGAAVSPDLATASEVASSHDVAARPDLAIANEVGGSADDAGGTGGAGGSADDAGGTGGTGGSADDAGGTGGAGGSADDAGGTGGTGGSADDAGGTGGAGIGGSVADASGTGGAGVDGNGTGGAGGNGADATFGIDSTGTPDGAASQDSPVDVAADGAGGAGGTGGTGGTGVDTDLVLWYKFDESTGTTAADSSMYSSAARNATLATIGTVGGATFSNVKQVGTHAVKLTPATTSANANGGYVTVPALQTLAPSALTIAVWVNLAAGTASQNWERIFDFGTGNTATNYFYLTARDGNSATTPVQFVISTNGHLASSGQVLEGGPSALTPNLWHHIAVVLPAGPVYTGTMYIDGVPVATNNAMTLHATDIGATTNNWLGRSQFSGASGNDPCFNGYLDDFRVYRRALSQAEISALFSLR